MILQNVCLKWHSLFAPYEFFYVWRKITGNESIEKDGISSLHTMPQDLFNKARLRDVMRNFIYFPDSSKVELKVDLIMLLAKFGYPPVDRDEVYKEIFEQAENFKKSQKHAKS